MAKEKIDHTWYCPCCTLCILEKSMKLSGILLWKNIIRNKISIRLTWIRFIVFGRSGRNRIVSDSYMQRGVACMSLKRRRSLDNDGMFHLVPFYSVVIPSSLTQQSSCRRGTDHLGIISFMALPYGPPLACKWILFESCTTMHSAKPIHSFSLVSIE